MEGEEEEFGENFSFLLSGSPSIMLNKSVTNFSENENQENVDEEDVILK